MATKPVINKKGMMMGSLDNAKTSPGFAAKQKASIEAERKMTEAQVAKRKKTMVSNAASKLMGGLYSK